MSKLYSRTGSERAEALEYVSGLIPQAQMDQVTKRSKERFFINSISDSGKVGMQKWLGSGMSATPIHIVIDPDGTERDGLN